MLARPKLRGWLLATALLWMVATNAVVIWNTRVRVLDGYGDFASLYTAGTQVRRGQADCIYNPSAQWKVQQQLFPEVTIRQGPLPYVRPPFEALLFSQFAAWPYSVSLILWTILKLCLLAAIPFIVVRRKSWRATIPLWAVGIAAIGTFPEFMDLLMGQDAALFAFLFAIAYSQLDMHRDNVAGFVLGLALFKFQLVAPFVLALCIGGRKRVLPGFAISAAAMIAISAVMVGWRNLLQYPGYLLTLNRALHGGMIWSQNQMNLRGLLSLFTGRLPYPGRSHWLLGPIALIAITYAGNLWRKAGDLFLPESFGVALVATIVTSYYAYEYDLLLLMIPFLAILARDERPQVDRVTRYLEVTGISLLFLTPAYWLAREKLHAECLMVLPLIAVGIALARRLKIASKPPSQLAPADGRA